MNAPLIAAVSLAYLCLLFAVAWFADRRADQGRSLIANPLTYALSIAVYHTSWTFYGSVGRAATDGVGFLPVYLGPTLMLCLSAALVAKMVRIGKTHRITSIADFISARYGKSGLVGGLVTVIAVVGVMPYVSLQLKAVSTTFNVLLTWPEPEGAPPLVADSALLVAAILAAFAILFGTRHIDASERHEGMVAAIAFESLVKLLAFLAVGGFVVWGLYDGFGDVFSQGAAQAEIRALFTLPDAGSYGDWVGLTVLSMLVILCLPRQPALVGAIGSHGAACILLDEAAGISVGSKVKSCGGAVEVPVGPEMLGRIVDPLGRPLDGLSPAETELRLPAERSPPAILDRDLVTRPLHTGSLVIDALMPLGRGQRELIVGDRRTGKTTLGLDAVLAQSVGDVICVYASIGQRSAATLQAIQIARAAGKFENCTFVVAPADAPAGQLWLAPFSACSIAEHFRDAGRDVLLVIDDLTKHASIH